MLETGLVADVALIKAWKGDELGNLVYRKTARNFNPMMATAARVTVAEVEEIVKVGTFDPDHIHTPGIFVQRLIKGTPTKSASNSAPPGRHRSSHALDTRTDGGTRGKGAARRFLRQPRHRHPDAGGQLHPARHGRDAAIRERHAGHGPVSARRRGRCRPHQRRQADHHRAAADVVFLVRRSRSP